MRVAALGIPGGLVIGVHASLPVAVFDVALDRLVERGGGPFDHDPVLADVGDQAFHLQGDGVGFVVGVGEVDVLAVLTRTSVVVEGIEFGL